MRPQDKSSTWRTASVTFGLLSLLAGAFFFLNGLVIHFTREGIAEAGNIWLLELVGPFIALGIALFTVTLVLIILPR